MTAGDDYWPTVTVNLIKDRKSWMRRMSILGREGSDLRISGLFFNAVVQAVLLFRSETWALTPRMERALFSS